MAFLLAELRALTDDELIQRHDVAAPPYPDTVEYYLNELARREATRQTAQMLAYTVEVRNLTRVDACAADGVARMARLGVRLRARRRSLAARNRRVYAGLPNVGELARTVAPTRQAGGHWFEPSTAHHRKALLVRGFFVSRL